MIFERYANYYDLFYKKKDYKGEIKTRLFAKEQSYKSMLKILGY